MGLMCLKKFSFLFLLISASLFSTYFAGGRSKFMSNLDEDLNSAQEGGGVGKLVKNEEEVSIIHERLLRSVNTKDYGRYDPSPALSKPPFKLIPN